jgi:hypothetical protein
LPQKFVHFDRLPFVEINVAIGAFCDRDYLAVMARQIFTKKDALRHAAGRIAIAVPLTVWRLAGQWQVSNLAPIRTRPFELATLPFRSLSPALWSQRCLRSIRLLGSVAKFDL